MPFSFPKSHLQISCILTFDRPSIFKTYFDILIPFNFIILKQISDTLLKVFDTSFVVSVCVNWKQIYETFGELTLSTKAHDAVSYLFFNIYKRISLYLGMSQVVFVELETEEMDRLLCS